MSADRYEMAGYRAELRSQLLELQKHLWSTSDALHAHSVHLHDLRYILTRHRVAPELIEKRLRSAERGFLRQCLYRNGFHRWLTRLFGHDPASGWRQD